LPRFGPGSWVGLYSHINFAGSYGLPVRDRDTNQVMLLTASHVIGGLFPFSTSETEVLGYGQLSETDRHDTTTSASEAVKFHIGPLFRSVPPDKAQKCTVDAAIARVSSNRSLVNEIDGETIVGCRDTRAEIDVDIPVRMFGASSNLRTGVLNTAPVTEKVEIGKSGDLVTYQHACYIESRDESPFAAQGDSGSVVIDADGFAVAMVVGLSATSNDGVSNVLATPMAAVLEELRIDVFIDTPMVETPGLGV
jgi:hypothetical protein